MKKILCYTLVIFYFLLFTTIRAQEKWDYASPGGGGWWTSTSFSPNTNRIFAVADLMGVYYTDDFGKSWTLSGNDASIAFAKVLTLPGGDTVITASMGGLHRSIDNGETWKRLGNGQIYDNYQYAKDSKTDTISVAMSAIEYFPNNSKILLAGTGYTHRSGGSGNPYGPTPRKVWKSTDGGDNWKRVDNNKLPTTSNGACVSGMTFHPTNPNCYIVGGTPNGIYMTKNDGVTWSKVSDYRISDLGVSPTNPNQGIGTTIYGGSTSKSVIRCDDIWNAGNWYPIMDPSEGMTNGSEVEFVGNRVYVGNYSGGAYGIYYSDDMGLNWNGIGERYGILSYTRDIAIKGNQIMLANSELSYSNDFGSTFENTLNINQADGSMYATGPMVTEYFDMQIDPFDDNNMVANQWDSGSMYSRDGGKSWKYSNMKESWVDGHESNNDYRLKEGYEARYNPYKQNELYGLRAVNDSKAASYLCKSTDGGVTWIKVSNNLPTSSYHQLLFPNSSSMLVSAKWAVKLGKDKYSRTGIWRSTNGGLAWTQVLSARNVYSMVQSKSNPNVIYATAQNTTNSGDKGIYRSNDYGKTWYAAYNGEDIGTVTSVAINPNNPNKIFFTTQYNKVHAEIKLATGIFKSTDGGNSFTKVYSSTEPFAMERFTDIIFDNSNSNVLYATSMGQGTLYDKGIPDFGLYASTDGGNTWSSINKNLPGLQYLGIIQNKKGELFTYTDGNGAYKLELVKFSTTAPQIDDLEYTKDNMNNSVTITTTFDNGSDNNTVIESFLGSDTLNWENNLVTMAISGNQGTYTYNGLLSNVTYYIKVKATNNSGTDISDTRSLVFNSVSVVDTTYPVLSKDDVYLKYGTIMYDYAYMNIGSYLTNSQRARAGIHFNSINNFSTIDSAKLYLTSWDNQGYISDDYDIIIKIEDAYNGNSFTDDTDYANRFNNSLSITDTLKVQGQWQDNQVIEVDITDIISGLVSKYQNANQISFTIFMYNNVTDKLRSIHSISSESGRYKPRLVLFGKKSDTQLDKKFNKKTIPTKYCLRHAYPNPFNPSTTISYSLPFTSNVRISIYDIMGREVKTYNMNSLSVGTHSTIWNGKNNYGENVSSGVYILRLKANSLEGNFTTYEKSLKLLLTK